MDKTMIFCTSYIVNGNPNLSLDRWHKWRNYYSARLTAFGADRLFLIDDATQEQFLEDFKWVRVDLNKNPPFPMPLSDSVQMFRFPEHLGRSMSKTGPFPGWWRSFTFAVKVARQLDYTKIIHFESDAFVRSTKLAERIRKLNSGWIALHCESWKRSESAIQVICHNRFTALEGFWCLGAQSGWQIDGLAERILPFTEITDFRGDRYGGSRLNCQSFPRDADYVCQSKPDWDFQGYLKESQPG